MINSLCKKCIFEGGRGRSRGVPPFWAETTSRLRPKLQTDVYGFSVWILGGVFLVYIAKSFNNGPGADDGVRPILGLSHKQAWRA